jgi:KipI family sensor histidine kinase inhibitor
MPAERIPRVLQASDHSALVVFADVIDTEANRDVQRFVTLLERSADPFILNLHPAYSSVLVSFDPAQVPPSQVVGILEERLRGLGGVEPPPPRTMEIPVCYEAELGPDLADVAASHGLSPEEVARLHCEAEYRVYFVGFSPGFPYLGGLSPDLATPRLAAPRTRVPAGSVGIAGAQTGIYPVASPGGWRIIGRTPLRLFDAGHPERMLLRMGDRVLFRRIAREEFERIAGGADGTGGAGSAGRTGASGGTGGKADPR